MWRVLTKNNGTFLIKKGRWDLALIAAVYAGWLDQIREASIIDFDGTISLRKKSRFHGYNA